MLECLLISVHLCSSSGPALPVGPNPAGKGVFVVCTVLVFGLLLELLSDFQTMARFCSGNDTSLVREGMGLGGCFAGSTWRLAFVRRLVQMNISTACQMC